MKILIGSNNSSKQSEISSIFNESALEPITPQDLSINYDPPEVSGTHKEIAEQKALQWSKITEYLVISTDGGLIIPSLGKNWDSTYTKRKAGEHVSDQDRAEHLLQTLKAFKGVDRAASWVESVAIAQSNTLLMSEQVEGPQGEISEILPVEEISPFWVNHIWYFPDKEKTYHHMSKAEKTELFDHWITITRLVSDFFKYSYREP